MPTPMIDTLGTTHDVPDEYIDARLAQGWRPQTTADMIASANVAADEAAYGGVGGGIKAGAAALARGATLGLSDVAARALGGEDTAIALEGYREAHPYVSFGGELIGNVAPALVTGGALAPAGAAASLGRSAATAAGGGLRGALAAGAVEGGLAGVGLGASELALSRDPLTFERAAATLGSNALFGAAAGGVLGAAANGVERGLHRAGAAIDEYAARRAAREAVAPDLVNMDRKGLKLAEEAELARIEAERVGQRASVADEIATFRDDLKQQKIWLTTKKGADEAVPPVETPDAGAPTAPPAPTEFAGPVRVRRVGRPSEGRFEAVDSTGTSIPLTKAEINAYAAKQLPAGWTREGLETHRDFSIEQGVPDSPAAIADNALYVVRPSELADRGILGNKIRPKDLESVSGAMTKGDQLPPVEVHIADDGELWVFDGNHRLLAAAKDDRPVAVKFKRGDAPAIKGDDPTVDISDRLRGASGASALSESEFETLGNSYRSQLSPEEIGHVREYTYDTGYALNRQLRKNAVADGAREQVDAMDAALSKASLPRDVKVYRGLHGDDVEKIYADMKPGDRFRDRAYGSTAIDHETARRGPVTFEVDVPAGYQAAVIPHKSGLDREILLRRDATYEVVGVRRTTYKNIDGEVKPETIVHVRVVPDDGPRPVSFMNHREADKIKLGQPIERVPSAERGRPSTSTPTPTPPSAPVVPPQIEGLGPLGKRLLKTDRALDRLLDNPKALAERPQRALDALQMQEAAYESILAKSDQLRIKFAADTSGDRIAALESIPAALERNRQLQQKIGALLQPPRTPRLDAISEARDVLMQPAAPKGMVEQIFGGAAFGAVTSAVGSIPVLGQIPGVAAIIGAKGAELATRVVFGKMGASIGAQAERAGNIVKALTGAVKTAAPFAPVVATRTLAALRYGKDEGEQPQSLPALYKKRTDEIKQLTAYDETGTPRLRPAVREQLGRALRPIAAVDPILADRIETQKARGIEYLSSILPRRPDLPGVNDNWHPSDMDMRSWARSAAAVEDPYGVLERAIHGAVTPEDAAVMRNVWPEMLAAFTGEVMARRESMPYHRQLSLSILTGAPVTPAMDPKVMRVLQSQFPDEPGSAGGTQAPKAQPQFGSMRATTDQMTPSQSRVQGAV